MWALRRVWRWRQLKGVRTASELAVGYGVHPKMIHQWKQALHDGAADKFEQSSRRAAEEVSGETI